MFNSRTAIAGAIIGLLLAFLQFKEFESYSGDVFLQFKEFELYLGARAETGSGAKKRVVLRREVFRSNFKVEW